MANWKKLAQGAAGAAGAGGGLNVEDVFSTYLYKGTSANQSITNGIDLSTEGGLVWVKNRDNANDHVLVDTERGALNYLHSNQSYAEQDATTGINAFNTDGFDVDGIGALWNNSSYYYASWTWRKAPRFFDCVTYTGDGTSGRTVSHNLGSVPNCIFVKSTGRNESWSVYHSGTGNTKHMKLNNTDYAYTDSSYWNNTTPTDTVFTLGNNGQVNENNDTYVAYLFAHNDGDGEFGPDGDQDIIKCGSYTGTGSSGNFIDLGFEPQWVLLKNTTTGNRSWGIFDNMRGVTTGGTGDIYLEPNTTNADANPVEHIDFNARGFTLTTGAGTRNASSNNYIYIAIRRGPMAVPTDATDVFAIDTRSAGGPNFVGGFPVDMALYRSISTTDNWFNASRMTGTKYLFTNSTASEASFSDFTWDFMDGWAKQSSASSTVYSWMWKRAPNYFDVVAYTGDNSSSHAINHNLNAVPEMMWVKGRDIAKDWNVYHSGLGTSGGTQGYLSLNKTDIAAYSAERFAAAPTDTQFTVGNNSRINSLGSLYIAYLFASVDGVSKVGSYTGNGSSQNIDCGFSSGARFVLVKAYSTTSNWQLAGDFGNGIVAGSDSLLRLDLTNAVVNFDFIDPYSGGFNVTGGQLNTNGTEYIFYAVA